MKKLLVLSVLLVSLTLSAQVREFAIGAFDNSIVREVNDTTVLIYAEESPTSASFLLYTEGSTVAQAFTLPNNLYVRDVRIWKGKLAYFCGTCNVVTPISTKKVLVGWFDISGVFSGMDRVLWTWFDPSPSPEIVPLEMRRLDLFEVGGTVCMAMVGDAVHIDDTIATVMSAFNVGANWQAYTMVHKGNKKYTDIVCHENVVAAVGTYQADTGCVVNTFRPTPDFPAQSCHHMTKENVGVQEIEKPPYTIGAINNQYWYNPVLFNVKVEETCRYEQKAMTR